MGLLFPSPEFDDAVFAVCHGTASENQLSDLNQLLLASPIACDEYLLRLELHSRLASTPDLFAVSPEASAIGSVPGESPAVATGSTVSDSRVAPNVWWGLAAALCLAFVTLIVWPRQDAEPPAGATTTAIAMLNRTVDVQWSDTAELPKLESPLDPGWLKLHSGLAEVVFYSGARVTLKGPASLQLISSDEVFCQHGKLTAEVPREARGFRVRTPQGVITDLGTEFGLNVTAEETEVHVFKGSVQLQSVGGRSPKRLQAGDGAFMKPSSEPELLTADTERFASLYNFEKQCAAAQAIRYDQWRLASDKLNLDPSLLVHFDFEYDTSTEWQLRNASASNPDPASATIIGCRWNEGRWPSKAALEFQSVNDRVRMFVPGEYEALTLTTWIRVQGLDRKFNSLFMSEGFEPGTVHWLIRNDGVLGLTILGRHPGEHQIVASPPVISLDRFGMWLHLAVVLDANAKRVQHFVNGRLVDEQPLQIAPPYVVGHAELGNWNANGFPGHDSLLIRNFSGAMDEFCLFGRALGADEIESQYHDGDPRIPH